MFEIELFICIKMDLALNNQQRLIYHKTQTNKQPIRSSIRGLIFSRRVLLCLEPGVGSVVGKPTSILLKSR